MPFDPFDRLRDRESGTGEPWKENIPFDRLRGFRLRAIKGKRIKAKGKRKKEKGKRELIYNS